MLANAAGSEAQNMRLLVRVAKLHYEQGLKQNEIASRYSLSTSKVSRILKRAADMGIVKTVVQVPDGIHAQTEQELEEKYGLSEAVIVDVSGSHAEVLANLSIAAANHLENTLFSPTIVGVSAWSETLMSVASCLGLSRSIPISKVVQLDGGAGHTEAQMQAVRMLDRFVAVSGGQPIVIPAPGVASSHAMHEALLHDPIVKAAMDEWAEIQVALLGIGAIHRSAILRRSGNYASRDDVDHLVSQGAVGDICLRYFDADGASVSSDFDSRVVGMTLEQITAIPRRIGIAGGNDKTPAIRAALRGKLLTSLITDIGVARALLNE